MAKIAVARTTTCRPSPILSAKASLQFYYDTLGRATTGLHTVVRSSVQGYFFQKAMRVKQRGTPGGLPYALHVLSNFAALATFTATRAKAL